MGITQTTWPIPDWLELWPFSSRLCLIQIVHPATCIRTASHEELLLRESRHMLLWANYLNAMTASVLDGWHIAFLLFLDMDHVLLTVCIISDMNGYCNGGMVRLPVL